MTIAVIMVIECGDDKRAAADANILCSPYQSVYNLLLKYFIAQQVHAKVTDNKSSTVAEMGDT